MLNKRGQDGMWLMTRKEEETESGARTRSNHIHLSCVDVVDEMTPRRLMRLGLGVYLQMGVWNVQDSVT
jgi:hypothetical protein